ncbi:hypothetical protein MRX96_052958, partial [Rhipicephalus microplus]
MNINLESVVSDKRCDHDTYGDVYAPTGWHLDPRVWWHGQPELGQQVDPRRLLHRAARRKKKSPPVVAPRGRPCRHKNEKIPKVTTVLLEFFIKRENKVSLLRDPLSHFCQEHLCLKRAPATARSLGLVIRKLTIIVGELATSLEKISEVPVTDWMAVGDAVVTRTDKMRIDELPPFHRLHSEDPRPRGCEASRSRRLW